MSNKSAEHLPDKFSINLENAALGATIHNLELSLISDHTFKEIHNLWLNHIVLIFRNQKSTAEQIVKLVKRFGKPITSSNLHERNLNERTANNLFDLPPEITVVTNLRQNDRPVGILGDGEVVWHSDFSFKKQPTAARMLLAVEIPKEGGHTYFTNCYAAYDTLPSNLKQYISGKTIKQANIVDTAMQIRPGASLNMDIREIPGPSHPIISTHPETGNNMIFLGRRHSAYVNGLSIEESESLLDELWKHTTQSEFTYKHEWQTGDIVIWDNRASLHRRDAFNSNSRRILYAAQVEGHAPFESNKSLENPSHPRYSQYFKK